MSNMLQHMKNERKDDNKMKNSISKPANNLSIGKNGTSVEKAKKMAILSSDALNRISHYFSSDEEMPTQQSSQKSCHKSTSTQEKNDDLIKSYKEREEKKEMKRKRKFNTEGGSFWSLGKVCISFLLSYQARRMF